MICKQAGASLIIVTGTSKDRARLDVAKKLRGRLCHRRAERRLRWARIMEITGGKGARCIARLHRPVPAPFRPCSASRRSSARVGVIVAQVEMAQFPNFPLEKFTVAVHHHEERPRP